MHNSASQFLFLQRMSVVLLAGLLAACSTFSSPTATETVTQETGPIVTPIAATAPETVTELTPQQTESEVVDIPTTTFKQGDVLWIQGRLQQLGYYNGPTDGAAGQSTQNAIKTYQQDQGMEQDGLPTTEFREFMWRNGG